jgi:S1-C subfamily serine protease
LPNDAYLAKGDKFLEQEFEAPSSPILAQGKYEGKGPVIVQYGNVVATLGGFKSNDLFTPTFKVQKVTSEKLLAKFVGTSSSYPSGRARIIRLDANVMDPQVVFTSSSGGAHCCTATQIVTADGREVKGEQLDADGYSFEDIDQDGAAELISPDNSFLYRFASYAASWAPPRVHRLAGGMLVDVTREPEIRPFIERSLREMEYQAHLHPALWGENGFLGGWIATKALLGEVDEAWRRMLVAYDRNPMFSDEECSIAVKLEQCPPTLRLRIPFPETLRKHLLLNGYPVPLLGPTSQPSATGKEPAAAETTAGSGFFITSEGHLITNAHVVEDCRKISVSNASGGEWDGKLAGRDATNDLAIIKIEASPPAVAALRSGVRLGEGVAAFGFPLFGLLSSGGNFTLGNVTALAGLRDDSRKLQISTPVQPGNSGGPLLDETGAVVGIVVSKLNAIKMAIATDDMPQNVNFAIKETTAHMFAEAQGLRVQIADSMRPDLRPADLADVAKSISARIECLK